MTVCYLFGLLNSQIVRSSARTSAVGLDGRYFRIVATKHNLTPLLSLASFQGVASLVLVASCCYIHLWEVLDTKNSFSTLRTASGQQLHPLPWCATRQVTVGGHISGSCLPIPIWAALSLDRF